MAESDGNCADIRFFIVFNLIFEDSNTCASSLADCLAQASLVLRKTVLTVDELIQDDLIEPLRWAVGSLAGILNGESAGKTISGDDALLPDILSAVQRAQKQAPSESAAVLYNIAATLSSREWAELPSGRAALLSGITRAMTEIGPGV